MDPDGRGDRVLAEHSKELESDLQEIPEEERQRFEENYRKHFSAWLHSLSRCASSMVTGPARFPVERMKKRSQWADNKYEAFREWRTKALNAIDRKARANRTPEEKLAELWAQVCTRIQDAAETVIRIDKGIERGYARELFVRVIVKNVEVHAKNGNTEIVRRALNLLRHLNTIGPRPIVTERHKVWSLEEQSTVAAERKADTQARESVEYVINDIRIIYNYQEDRMQMVFQDKAHAMRHIKDLKGNGWHWSPRFGAWQRKLTNAAKYSAIKMATGAPVGSMKSQVNGKELLTVIFQTVEEANTFMSRNPDWGVLGEDQFGIHVAMCSDKGM